MFNYEKILLEELNYVRSCVMPDGAVLHRPVDESIIAQNGVDVITVIPYEACIAGLVLVQNYSETVTAQQIIQWYINNMINPLQHPHAPTWAYSTIPCFLYTVGVNRTFTVEVIDYSFLEILQYKNDPTSPYYAMANDPVRQYLFETYLRQTQHAAAFLTFIELYIKDSQNYTWAYANLQEFSLVANLILTNILEYQGGNDPVLLPLTLRNNLDQSSDSYLLDIITAYDGLQGTNYLLSTVENPSAPLFAQAALGVQRGLNLFMVNNQFTAPVGILFAEELQDIKHGVGFRVDVSSVPTLETQWNAMSLQLQAYFYLGANVVQSIIATIIPEYYDIGNLYQLLNQAYPTWSLDLPDSYDAQQPWMVGGAIALLTNDTTSCITQLIASREVRTKTWNIVESGWTTRNIFQLLNIFKNNPLIAPDLVWNRELATSIPISFQELYTIPDKSYVTPHNSDNQVFFYYGDPLNINGTPSELYQFLELVYGTNIWVLVDYGAVTDDIIQLAHKQGVQIFLRIQVGSDLRGSGVGFNEASILIANYAARGVSGIFLDALGTTNNVDPVTRQGLINQAHASGLPVIVNVATVTDVVALNNTTTSLIGIGDFLLLDNFATGVAGSNLVATLTSSIARGQEAVRYKEIYGFGIMAIAYSFAEDISTNWMYNPNNVLETSLIPPQGACVNTSLQNYYGNYDAITSVSDRVVEAGFSWIRNYCYWSQVEMGLLGNRDYTVYDNVVKMAKDRNLQILFVLAYDNTLAPIVGNFEVFAAAYLSYVTSTVTHFKGQVAAWEIWNQEDLIQYWQLNPNPLQYASLLQAAYTIIKTIDPTALVVLGSIGSLNSLNASGTFTGGNVLDTTYLSELYAIGANAYFDVLGLSPVVSVDLTAPILNPVDVLNLDYVTSIQDVLGIMQHYGDERKPIWFTNIGLPTFANGSITVTQETQTAYAVAFYGQLQVIPQLTQVFWYEMVDAGPNQTLPSNNFGLLTNTLMPKTTYLTLKNMIQGTSVPQNLDLIMPIWQTMLQYAYILFLMLGLDYFQYAIYRNLTYAFHLTPPYVPITIIPQIQAHGFLSELIDNNDGTFQRKVPSGELIVGVVNNNYLSGLNPFTRPLMINITCPSCLAILHNIEEGKSIEPYTVNGFVELRIMESLGWDTIDPNFGVAQNTVMMGVMIDTNTMPNNVNMYVGQDLLIMQGWVFKNLMTLSTAQLSAGRWCNLCGVRIF